VGLQSHFLNCLALLSDCWTWLALSANWIGSSTIAVSVGRPVVFSQILLIEVTWTQLTQACHDEEATSVSSQFVVVLMRLGLLPSQHLQRRD
jgi:hypothetical protein